MNTRHVTIAVLAPVAALALSGCANLATDGSVPPIGTYGELRSGPGPSENAQAVLGELKATDRKIDDLRDGGQLTKRETRALRREQARSGLLALSYGADGVISDSERREAATRGEIVRAQANATALLSGFGEEPDKKPE